MLNYRLMTTDDYEAVYDLWIKCGNGLNNKDDSREGIEKYLKRNPNTSYVAVLDGNVVGCILCGHDGRRGIIQHACVSSDCRRMGIGKKLVDLALDGITENFINEVAKSPVRWGLAVHKIHESEINLAVVLKFT